MRKQSLATSLYYRINSSESFNNFFATLRRTLTLNGTFLILMSSFRVISAMAFGQHNHWSSQGFPELLKAFWMGIRFDAVILGYMAAIPSLLIILALHIRSQGIWELTLNVIKKYYFFFFFIVSCLLAIDIGFYSFFQDHFNILVFGLIEDDTAALLKTFWKNYPMVWMSLGAIVYGWLLYKLTNKILHPLQLDQTIEKTSFWLMPIASIALLSCVVIVSRGSFGLFPLGPADTVISSDPFVNHLTSNGIHALYRAFKLRKQSNLNWDNNLKLFGYTDPRQAFADFYSLPLDKVPAEPLDLFHKKTAKNIWAEKMKPHVVVVVLESFGTYYLQYQSEKFQLLGEFEKHTQQDLFLKNFLPSASSTTGSLSSLMISAPHRPVGNFLTESEYLQVPFRSSPARVFSKAGYETHFVYGGNPGWRDMNKFARFQGFDFVDGEADIEKSLGKLTETHDWGVYDEDVYRYVEKLLAEAKKPKMILLMTTTNHPPYQTPSNFKQAKQEIPPNLKEILVGDAELIQNRFKTYYYSNEMVGRFISKIKESPLAEKTILSVTGDHSFWLVQFSDQQLFQKWGTPFYLYTPTAIRPKLDPETFASHMDIFPTMYNLALSDFPYESLGHNILDPQAPHYALHSSGLIASAEGGALVGGANNLTFLKWQTDSHNNYEQLIQAEEDAPKRTLATQYKSLMSLLDYYFMQEKKLNKNSNKKEP